MYLSAKAYFPAILFKACDSLHCKLEDRFNEHIHSVLTIEKTLIDAASGDTCSMWS